MDLEIVRTLYGNDAYNMVREACRHAYIRGGVEGAGLGFVIALIVALLGDALIRFVMQGV